MTDLQEMLRQYRQEYDRVMPAIQKLEEALAKQRRNLDSLETQIKETVKNLGHSEKGFGICVTYRSGYPRYSWDNNKLEGFAAVYPEILAFRKQTDVGPSVSMRVEDL